MSREEENALIEEIARMKCEDLCRTRPGSFLSFDKCSEAGRNMWRRAARQFIAEVTR